MSAERSRPDPNTPHNENQAAKILLERFTHLSTQLSHVSANVSHLRDRLGHMAELAGRVNAAFVMMVGLPRMMRSDLFHSLTGAGGGSSGKSGRSFSSKMVASGSKDFDPDKWLEHQRLKKENLAEARRLFEEQQAAHAKVDERVEELAVKSVGPSSLPPPVLPPAPSPLTAAFQSSLGPRLINAAAGGGKGDGNLAEAFNDFFVEHASEIDAHGLKEKFAGVAQAMNELQVAGDAADKKGLKKAAAGFKEAVNALSASVTQGAPGIAAPDIDAGEPGSSVKLDPKKVHQGVSQAMAILRESSPELAASIKGVEYNTQRPTALGESTGTGTVRVNPQRIADKFRGSPFRQMRELTGVLAHEGYHESVRADRPEGEYQQNPFPEEMAAYEAKFNAMAAFDRKYGGLLGKLKNLPGIRHVRRGLYMGSQAEKVLGDDEAYPNAQGSYGSTLWGGLTGRSFAGSFTGGGGPPPGSPPVAAGGEDDPDWFGRGARRVGRGIGAAWRFGKSVPSLVRQGVGAGVGAIGSGVTGAAGWVRQHPWQAANLGAIGLGGAALGGTGGAAAALLVKGIASADWKGLWKRFGESRFGKGFEALGDGISKGQAWWKSKKGKKARDRWSKATSKFSHKLGSGVVGVAGAAAGIASAGAPDAFATLTGSFRLLAGSIAEFLQPTLIKWAKKLQEWANEIGNLTDEQKKQIFEWVEFGAKVVLGAAALSGLIRVVSALGPIFTGFGYIISLLGVRASVTAGALGLTAIGLYELMDAQKKQLKENSDRIKQALEGSTDENPLAILKEKTKAHYLGQEAVGDQTAYARETDAWKARVDQLVKDKKYKEAADLVDQEAIRKGTYAADLQAASNPELTGISKIFAPAVGLGLGMRNVASRLIPGTVEKHQTQLSTEAAAAELSTSVRLRSTGAYLRTLSQGKSEEDALKRAGRVAPEKSKETLEKERIQKEMAKGKEAMAFAVSTKATAQYSGLEEAYKNLQIDVMDKDPLKIKELQKTMENLWKTQELIAQESLDVQRQIRDNTATSNGNVNVNVNSGVRVGP